MRPDQELNHDLSAYGTTLQPTEPHWPGINTLVLKEKKCCPITANCNTCQCKLDRRVLLSVSFFGYKFTKNRNFLYSPGIPWTRMYSTKLCWMKFKMLLTYLFLGNWFKTWLLKAKEGLYSSARARLILCVTSLSGLSLTQLAFSFIHLWLKKVTGCGGQNSEMTPSDTHPGAIHPPCSL